MKLVIASAAVLMLAACVRTDDTVAADNGRPDTSGLERRIESFSKPDKYGVMCYQDVSNARNLDCVQVTNGEYNETHSNAESSSTVGG